MPLHHTLKPALFVFWFMITGTSVQAQSSASVSTQPYRFIVFTGSDWCPHCKRFDKTILHDSVFNAFAQQHLTIVIADFPQMKKLPEQEIKQNEALAERYNPEGIFPRLVLIGHDNTSYNIIPYSNQTVSEFISLLTPYLK